MFSGEEASGRDTAQRDGEGRSARQAGGAVPGGARAPDTVAARRRAHTAVSSVQGTSAVFKAICRCGCDVGVLAEWGGVLSAVFNMQGTGLVGLMWIAVLVPHAATHAVTTVGTDGIQGRIGTRDGVGWDREHWGD